MTRANLPMLVLLQAADSVMESNPGRRSLFEISVGCSHGCQIQMPLVKILKLESADHVADLMSKDASGTQLTVSHLCHKSYCNNPKHVIFESSRNNSNRNSCVNKWASPSRNTHIPHHCGVHAPPCLLRNAHNDLHSTIIKECQSMSFVSAARKAMSPVSFVLSLHPMDIGLWYDKPTPFTTAGPKDGQMKLSYVDTRGVVLSSVLKGPTFSGNAPRFSTDDMIGLFHGTTPAFSMDRLEKTVKNCYSGSVGPGAFYVGLNTSGYLQVDASGRDKYGNKIKVKLTVTCPFCRHPMFKIMPKTHRNPATTPASMSNPTTVLYHLLLRHPEVVTPVKVTQLLLMMQNNEFREWIEDASKLSNKTKSFSLAAVDRDLSQFKIPQMLLDLAEPSDEVVYKPQPKRNRRWDAGADDDYNE